MTKPEKEARHLAMDQVKQEILTALGTEVEGREKEAKNLISEVKKKLVRHQMLADAAPHRRARLQRRPASSPGKSAC